MRACRPVVYSSHRAAAVDEQDVAGPGNLLVLGLRLSQGRDDAGQHEQLEQKQDVAVQAPGTAHWPEGPGLPSSKVALVETSTLCRRSLRKYRISMPAPRSRRR